MKEEKEGYVVVIPENVQKMIEGAPEDAREDIEKLIKGFVDGTINPQEVGEPLELVDMKEKLLCGACGSKNISWTSDGIEEVYYRCFACEAHAWMTLEEYEDAKKRHPECIFIA